jgi:mono/diheme cytochrome c family protein
MRRGRHVTPTRSLGLALVVALAASIGCRRESPSPAGTAPAADAGSASALADAASVARDGHALVVDDCLVCHSEELLAQQRLTPKQWEKTVKKMIEWGAPVDPETIDALVAHLAARYGTDAGPFEPSPVAAAEARAALAPLPDATFRDGDATRGLALYHDRCEACHAADARGQLGPALASKPVLYRAGDLAAVVRAGRGRMTPFGEATDRDVADLLAHLRRL